MRVSERAGERTSERMNEWPITYAPSSSHSESPCDVGEGDCFGSGACTGCVFKSKENKAFWIQAKIVDQSILQVNQA